MLLWGFLWEGAMGQRYNLGHLDIWELMRRDPLGRELTNLLVQLYWECLSESEYSHLMRRLRECEEELCAKYPIDHIYIPDPIGFEAFVGGSPKTTATKEQFRRFVEV